MSKLDDDDLYWLDELTDDDSAELWQTLPEIRPRAANDHDDDGDTACGRSSTVRMRS